MDIVFIVIGALAAGLWLGIFVGKRWGRAALVATQEQLQLQIQQKQKEMDHLQQRWDALQQEVGELRAGKQILDKQLQEQEKMLLDKVEQLTHKMLTDSRQTLHETHKTTLGDVLQPFQKQLDAFRQQVKEAYEIEIREKAGLSKSLEQLQQLNLQLSEDAKNLTKALKSDTQKQGNWGELVLERVLEGSGLTRGREYELQYADHNREGERIRPDAIIHLPEGKHIIIDAKVSLTAYVNWHKADNDTDREAGRKAHVLSLQRHISGLADKEYHSATGLHSPDFVLLFVPVEGAFMLAMQSHAALFEEAWKKRIVLVSPTTLLATLRTIEAIWRMERQNRNVQEIASLGGRMMDKVAGVLDDMSAAESAMQRAGERLQAATNKLHSGKGSLVSMAARMKKLGAEGRKQLPDGPGHEEEEED